MPRIRFAKSLAEALKGRDHVLVLAPESALKAGLPGQLFRGKWAKLLPRLVESAKAGPLGKVVTTWTGTAEPARVSLGLLPDSVARYLSPSRNVALQRCLSDLDVGPKESLGVIAALDESEHQVAAANALGRALPTYTRKSKARRRPATTFLAVDRQGRPLPLLRETKLVTEAARWAASLVERPAAELTAADFVDETAAALKSLSSVAMSVISGDELLEAGLGGLHAVGRAAEVAPRLMILQYQPAGGRAEDADSGPHVALVGKGIVYDTGGLSIKTGPHMCGMKMDMGGAAAVVGAFRALAQAKYPRRLSCLAALAENAIGPGAYRPDDILKLHSGRTVEINNTDAEGRIVLADAVSYAARELKVDAIIDAATLTGAQMVATGYQHAAVISNREGLERAAVAAGLASGDTVHPLPFAPEIYQGEFKSDVADMRNSVKDRMNAQAGCAAQFIHAHLEDTKTPWLHVDLSGPVAPAGRAVGWGVALLAELLPDLERSHLQA